MSINKKDFIFEKIGRISDYIYLVSFVALFTLMFIKTSTAYTITKNPMFTSLLFLFGDVFVFTSPLSVLYELYLNNKNNDMKDKKRGLVIGLCKMLLIYFVLYFVCFTNPEYSVYSAWLLLVFAITSTYRDEKKLLKIGFYIGLSLTVLLFLLSLIGLIENNRGTGFGFIYRTHYACRLLCLSVMYCLLTDGIMQWYGELGLVFVMIFDLICVKGKTCFVCMLFIVAVTFVGHYKREGKIPWQDKSRYGYILPILFRIIYLPAVLIVYLTGRLKENRLNGMKTFVLRGMTHGYTLCAGIMIFFTAFYRQLEPLINKVPGLSTVKSRLILGRLAFEQQYISLFGNNYGELGLSDADDTSVFYFAIDSAYIKILLMFGIIAFILYLLFFKRAQERLYGIGRYYAVFLLFVYALDGLMDYWMYDLSYDLFILLAFCRLAKKNEDKLEHDKTDSGTFDRRKRGLRDALALLCAVFLLLWCITAYQVSSFMGWTPEYNATIVVPGVWIDGAKNDRVLNARITQTREYLSRHPEAVCILCGTEEETDRLKNELKSRGIEEKRVYALTGINSVENMLRETNELVKKRELPSRLTICSFKMQQYRIGKCAEREHIPVNFLQAEIPWQYYMVGFMKEQWSVIR